MLSTYNFNNCIYNIYSDNTNKKYNKNISINYSFNETRFGKILLASTKYGLCCLAFNIEQEQNINFLYEKFPNATYQEKIDEFHVNSLTFFDSSKNNSKKIKLHLKGTPFQIKVWKALLTIPTSQLATYSKIANFIGNPKAFRAIGNAIGKNPICFIIPCHRVIKINGNIGGYAFGANIKQNIIDWEKSYLKEINKDTL